jgi:hypothetical protein
MQPHPSGIRPAQPVSEAPRTASLLLRFLHRSAGATAILALLLLAPACDRDKKPSEPVNHDPGGADTMPAFRLPDVNPSSATFGRQVSPRDHLGRISAWYFGHAG